MSVMIPGLESYFTKFIPQRDQLIKELEDEAKREDIPIVGPLVAELLYILARATGARQILELGTATGYSAIFLARAVAENNGSVVTLEWSGEMAQRAEENLKRAGVESLVEILSGDARTLLAHESRIFDFIFMDIDKEYYITMLPRLRRIIKTGGFMLVDNVGFKDARDFNKAIAESIQWRSVNLLSFLPEHSPEKDGLCFAVAI